MRPVVRRNALLKLNEARCRQGYGVFQCAQLARQSEYKIALQLYGYKAVTRALLEVIGNNGLTGSEINALMWPPRGRPNDELDRLPKSRLQSQLLELFNMHLHDINKKVGDEYGKTLLNGFFDLFVSDTGESIVYNILIFISHVEGVGGYNLGVSSLNDALRKHIRPIVCLTNERFGNIALFNSRSTFEFDSGEEYYGPFEQIKLKITVPRRGVVTFSFD
ncbi:hypothetical protein [Serratia marcescens]|uniref:Uncharacterized protein n=1 Tax=Serratia marcescens TaxID=615 RepID=A0ABD6HUI0_SERMA|nr:hypothetical protein [Serratia marcescens]MDT0205782.1 hypothetical protein [Serratia marcescens]MVF06047.1 hypothetical protein [Serratia marcescens]